MGAVTALTKEYPLMVDRRLVVWRKLKGRFQLFGVFCVFILDCYCEMNDLVSTVQRTAILHHFLSEEMLSVHNDVGVGTGRRS